MKFTKLFILIFFLTSCVSLNSKEKFLVGSLMGASLGGAVGVTISQKQKVKNALLWSGSLGFLSSLISYSFFNSDKEAKDLRERLKKLEEDFGLTFEGHKIKYLTGGKSYLTEKNIPNEFKEFVKFGSWYLYELQKDYGNKEWVSVGNNRLIKGSKMFELIPSKIKEKK